MYDLDIHSPPLASRDSLDQIRAGEAGSNSLWESLINRREVENQVGD